MIDLVPLLAREFAAPPPLIGNVLRLLDEGNTIPFIARYRKELTGSLDEVALQALRERARYLRELEERRETVLASIAGQGRLTDALRAQIAAAATKQVLEDLYLPYRPRRRTRASLAREQGLGPLAQALLVERLPDARADAAVAAFLAGHPEVGDGEAAWAGCRDILAETVAEDADTRAWLRELTWRKGRLVAGPTPDYTDKKTRFKDYYAFEEPLRSIPAHRYLALQRGEAEKVLRVRIAGPEEEIGEGLARRWCEGTQGRLRAQWRLLLEDAWRRLLAPAVESELRAALKEAADTASIAIFSENLRNLLLLPPGGQKVVLGLDPGFRSGSKWAVVDGTGRLLECGTIHPLPPRNQAGESARTLAAAVRRHKVEVIAVGNGTASRELLAFVRQMLRAEGRSAAAVLVNEAGASVYSASEIAREELPALDVTLRGAVSIARRWQDALSELVKIDPKSLGVGQYQHDVQQARLRASLDETVALCVNRVGVNLNTASWALLRYVSGLGAAQAKEIVVFRDARGAFGDRATLARVPRLGPKAFEQCAGFLRIPGAANPLDGSAVHPEHYPVVERMAADLKVGLAELVGNEALVARIDPERYVGDAVGRPTLEDILAELRKPGRDPRTLAETVAFDDDITEIGHLRPGMQLGGVVTNVTHFGAFVDIGVHQDGLVHISQLADRFVKNPSEEVQVGQGVRVTVLGVDVEMGRIALSMKSAPRPDDGRTGRGAGRPRKGASTPGAPASRGSSRPGGGRDKPERAAPHQPRGQASAPAPAPEGGGPPFRLPDEGPWLPGAAGLDNVGRAPPRSPEVDKGEVDKGDVEKGRVDHADMIKIT
jgi:uncharacterized protein